MERYSLSDIRNAYAQKKEWEKQFPVSYFLFRPLSFYVTLAVLRFTRSPGAVAWCGLCIGMAGNISLLFMEQLSLWPGVALLLLFALFDAVDGNVARTTRQVSHLGKFIDGTFGLVVEGSYCFWLGLGLFLFPENPYTHALIDLGAETGPVMLVSGIVVLAGLLYSAQIECAYDKHRVAKEASERKTDTSSYQYNLAAPIASSARSRTPLFLLYSNIHAFNAQLLLLVLCALTGSIHLFLLTLALYYALRSAVTFTFFMRRAYEKL